jgi:hypothetical protein
MGGPKRFAEAAVAYEGAECLFWPFARNSAGYGQIFLAGSLKYAHRFVCESRWGPAPGDKTFALHKCGNGARGCIAPLHLKWGDRAENMADMVADGHARGGKRR